MITQDTLDYITRLKQELEAEKLSNKRLKAGIDAVSDLISESQGISGLHLNGDIAPWNDLLQGGRYEEWLIDFSEALQKE